jgi:nucleotide-binding universal stress UspA family protein
MRIVVGFLHSPEGRAALELAIEEARRCDGELLVVHSMRGGERDELEQVLSYREEFEQLERMLTAREVRFRLVEYARGNTPAEDLLQVAREERAERIVIGIRRRTPVGKVVLGSNAQEILMGAPCPVLSIRAEED